MAETIDRGEKEQKTNAQKILSMQSKLKSLEDQLMAAQQASEDKVAIHEEQIRELKESHNVSLQRVKDGARQTRSFGPKSPLTPMLTNSGSNSVISPRITQTSSGRGISVNEDSRVEELKQRVVELEKALQDADSQMEEVVSKMNIAQIEVMELQNEREEAVRETRKLQRKVEEEKLKAFEGRWDAVRS